jgi:outer membrane lipoprotein-sorting protein
MKTYSRIFLIIALSLASFAADAMSRSLSEFLKTVSDSQVSFEYSFVMNREGAKITGDGSVTLQDDAFRLSGNGLEMWCDGSTSWTVDRSAEEILIQPVEDSGDDYASNPALLVTSVDKNFTELSGGESKFNGKVVNVSILSPREEFKSSSDISQMKLFFRTNTSDLIGLEVKMEDGSVCTFTISNFKTQEKISSKAEFRFNENIPSDYVVTDLR